MNTKPHFCTSKRAMERQKLNQMVISKYERILAHHNMNGIIAAHERIAGLTVKLNKKGIEYERGLKKALEDSPLEDATLSMESDIFRKMVEESNIQSIRRINDNFDIILMQMDEGLCLKKLQSFIADYGYKLASFGEKKTPFGFDPNYSMNKAARHQRSHGCANDE